MKNRSNPGGAGIGPRLGWAEWAARRAKRLEKPVRSAVVAKLNKRNEKPSPSPDNGGAGS